MIGGWFVYGFVWLNSGGLFDWFVVEGVVVGGGGIGDGLYGDVCVRDGLVYGVCCGGR